MGSLTQAHHDWVKNTLNIDPQVYDTPDADVEQELEDPNLLKNNKLLTFDTTGLYKDFSNSVHGACKRAKEAMGELYAIGAIAWNPSDARGGMAVLAKSGGTLSREDKAILETDGALLKQAVHSVESEIHAIEAATRVYSAAAQQLAAMPQKIGEPEPLKPDFLDANGDIIEHAWDFLNTMTQVTISAIGNLHLMAGLDLIKDALKNDQIQKQIEAINDQLTTHRETINDMIKAVSDRAQNDADNALQEYEKRVGDLVSQLQDTKKVVDMMAKHFDAFTAPKKGSKGESEDAKKVRQTYKAVVSAATASTIARKALNTKTLGPGAYKRFAEQMIPLGKPITDDAKTSGASMFHKGSVLVKYTTTVPITEALASGLEDVVAVYDEAPKIDQWMAAWTQAVSG